MNQLICTMNTAIGVRNQEAECNKVQPNIARQELRQIDRHSSLSFLPLLALSRGGDACNHQSPGMCSIPTAHSHTAISRALAAVMLKTHCANVTERGPMKLDSSNSSGSAPS